MAVCCGYAQRDANYELEPDVICYNAAISACEKGPQWQLAMGLLSVQATKMVPDVISYKLR